MEKLSGDYNRGYTKAIQDLQEVFRYVKADLDYHHIRFTHKIATKLLQCCLENREQLRDEWNGFIRYNSNTGEFEFYRSGATQ